jgi:mono/diheme cytochrome c family protein
MQAIGTTAMELVMAQARWVYFGLAMVLSLAALLLVRMHAARGESLPGAAAGHRLAEAWCRDCHAIGPGALNPGKQAPDFVAIANMPSATELSLRVFLQSSHPNMPNIILKPEQTSDLVAYILSLKSR